MVAIPYFLFLSRQWKKKNSAKYYLLLFFGSFRFLLMRKWHKKWKSWVWGAYNPLANGFKKIFIVQREKIRKRKKKFPSWMNLFMVLRKFFFLLIARLSTEKFVEKSLKCNELKNKFNFEVMLQVLQNNWFFFLQAYWLT